MAYSKYYPNGWQNGAAGGTPITPAALNHMEDGIADALPKSGGTITGPVRRSSDLDYDTVPSENATNEVLQALDSDGHARFRLYQNIGTSGNKIVWFMTRDDDGSGNMSDYNQFGIGLTPNGEPLFLLGSSKGSSMKALRKAISLGTSDGSLPIQISQGGTGATTAAGARSALGVAQHITMPDSNSWATLKTALDSLDSGKTALVKLGYSSSYTLTGGRVAGDFFGTVYKSSSNQYSFSCASDSVIINWSISNVTTTGATIGTVYRFTGAAMN